MLFQCWSSAVGGGPILKQHWVKCSRLLGSTQVSVYTHPSATIIFSPADQGTFSKTAGQSQAYYNTWNWERGTYDVNHLHILPCERAVSRVSSVLIYSLSGCRLRPLVTVNTKHSYNIRTMLDQRRRRWVDVLWMLYKCFCVCWDMVRLEVDVQWTSLPASRLSCS